MDKEKPRPARLTMLKTTLRSYIYKIEHHDHYR